MKLEVEPPELDSILASLGKSRHYFETKDRITGEWLQQIRLKLIKQGQKDGILFR